MKKLILLLLLISSQIAFSQWEKTGWINDATVNIENASGNILLLMSWDGLLVSKDRGKTWENCKINNPSLRLIPPMAFWKGKIYSNNAFGNICISADTGKSWTISKDISETFGITSFAFSENKVVACSWFNIFLSENEGESWENISISSSPNLKKLALYDNSIIATTYDGVYFSFDSGKNWILRNEGIPSSAIDYVSEIAIIGNNILIGTKADCAGHCYNQLFLSTDTGKSWTEKQNKKLSEMTFKLTTSENNYIAYSAVGAFISNDTASTWSEIPITKIFNGNIQVAADEKNIYLSNLIMVCSTSNLGKSWDTLYKGVHYGAVQTISTIGDIIFAGAIEGDAGVGAGLHISTDKGDSWNISAFDTLPIWWSHIIGNSLCVLSSGGQYITKDTGKSWDPWLKLLPDSIKNSYTQAIDGNNMYYGKKGVVYLSSDLGVSWVSKYKGLPIDKDVLTLAADGNNIIAGIDSALYLSTDMGNNWVLRNNGLPANIFISSSVIMGNNLIISNFYEIWISSDLGENWQIATSGLPSNSEVISMFSFDNYILAIRQQKGLFFSSNFGHSWKQFNEGLTNKEISSLSVCGDYIFAGTNSFLTGDNGDCIFRRKLSDFVSVIEDDTITKSPILISPNPASDFIEIKSETGLENIEIFSLPGTLMLSQKGSGGAQRIDVSGLPAGVYFVKIGSRVEKFVKM